MCGCGLFRWLRMRREKSQRPPALPPDLGELYRGRDKNAISQRKFWRRKWGPKPERIAVPSDADDGDDDSPAFWDISFLGKKESDGHNIFKKVEKLKLSSQVTANSPTDKKFPEGKVKISHEDDELAQAHSFSSVSSSLRNDPIVYMEMLAKIEAEDDCELVSKGAEKLPEIGPNGLDAVPPGKWPYPFLPIWSKAPIFSSEKILTVDGWIGTHEDLWLARAAREFGGFPNVLRLEPKPEDLEAAELIPRVVPTMMVFADGYVTRNDDKTQGKETEGSMEMVDKKTTLFDDMLAPPLFDSQASADAWLKMTYPNVDEEITNEDEDDKRVLDEETIGSSTGGKGGISTPPTSLASQEGGPLVAIVREINIPTENCGPRTRFSIMGSNVFPWTKDYMGSEAALVGVGPGFGRYPQLSKLDSRGPVYRLIGNNKKDGFVKKNNKVGVGDIKSRFNWEPSFPKTEFPFDPDPEV